MIIVKSAKTLYHYTDIHALTCILNKDIIKLRASNCLYLNDGREIEEGIDLLKEYLKIDYSKHSFRSYYISSFSNNRDNLTMWNMYAANGKGCAIGFKADKILSNSSEIFDFWVPCLYNKDEAKLFLAAKLSFIDKLHYTVSFPTSHENSIQKIDAETEVQNVHIETCLACKNASFHEENEFRGVIYRDSNQEIQFREKDGVIIPYVEVDIPKDAIEEIVIGPTNKSELTTLSVINMLQNRGYDWKNIKVTNSVVPYRG